ncbi:MAG: tetratricopeptide repeat protein [Candidatus Midichloria sp.]|nr:tetratricopeptide repeat protein [Candidatus Midichloria sp.]
MNKLISKEKVADILYSIGKPHYNNNNFIEVLWPYEKALSILNQLIAEQSEKRYYEKMATIYFDIASFHHQVKEFQEVLPFHQKALEIRITLF